MSKAQGKTRYLYWINPEDFEDTQKQLVNEGFRFSKTLNTPCQVLRSDGKKLVYAPPKIWSGMCKRQGSWYRESERAGQYMIMSTEKLPDYMKRFLDAEMSVSDFQPDRLPTDTQLSEVINAVAYQSKKPKEWERIGWKDSIMFKIFFTVTRFWGRGDNMRKHWLGHRANHANFLTKDFATEIEGEQVAYSVTENAGVCSSCAEFFNVVSPGDRKLVRSCPGSVTFGAAQRDVYYDVRPVKGTAVG